MPDGSPHSSAKNATQQLSRDSDFLQARLLLELALTLKDTHIFSSLHQIFVFLRAGCLKVEVTDLENGSLLENTLFSRLWCGTFIVNAGQPLASIQFLARPWAAAPSSSQALTEDQQAFTAHLHKVPWEIGILVFLFFFKSGGNHVLTFRKHKMPTRRKSK